MNADSTILAQLREHETFGRLPDAALRTLLDKSDLLRFAPNEIMLQQGSSSDFALFIVSGEAEISVETSYGDIHIARGTPRMLVGEIGAFTDSPRIATVRALTALDALRIDRPRLLDLGRENPEFLLFVIGQLGERLSRLNRTIGFYTNTLTALERNDFDTKLLGELRNPMPELADFSHSFHRLAEQITIKRQQFEEMANAAAIQRSMLPRPFEAKGAFAVVDLYGELHPAREVGGDFFDYFAIDEQRLAVSIGDVSGKGVPASLFMATTQSLIRAMLREGGDLSAELARINNLLVANNEESVFVTAFCTVLTVDTGEIVYCNCGHNAPLLQHRDGGIDRLSSTGPPLAASADSRFRAVRAHLAAGDRLTLFSDGLEEATNQNNEFFGEAKIMLLARELADHSARELVRGIIRRVVEFENGCSRYDDIACVSLVYRGVDGSVA